MSCYSKLHLNKFFYLVIINLYAGIDWYSNFEFTLFFNIKLIILSTNISFLNNLYYLTADFKFPNDS